MPQRIDVHAVEMIDDCHEIEILFEIYNIYYIYVNVYVIYIYRSFKLYFSRVIMENLIKIIYLIYEHTNEFLRKLFMNLQLW